MTPGNSTLADSTEERVVIIGGGVVGLSVAVELARRGLPTAVVDPGPGPGQATWASGGMLAPLGEADAPGPFLDLALLSLELYPEFVRTLEGLSGVSVDLRLNGKVLAALSEDDESAIRSRERWLRAEGHTVTWLPAGRVREALPTLNPAVRGGLLLEGNGCVNSRALLRGLQDAARALGVEMIRGRATGLQSSGGAVCGVTLDSGETVRADHTVVAAGAWSHLLAGFAPGAKPDTRPVKGEMLAFSTPDRVLDRVVTSPRVYLIPRETPEGPVVLAGATEEDAGFDTSVTPVGQGGLESAAVELLPALGSAPVVERWAGLRPGTPDRLPLIGPDPEVDGLHLATGHFRNGILLAPATARLVADALCSGDSPEPSRGRFSALAPSRLVTRR